MNTRVELTISGNTVEARIRLPRWVLVSVLSALGVIATNALRIELQIIDVRHELAECRGRLNALEHTAEGN